MTGAADPEPQCGWPHASGVSSDAAGAPGSDTPGDGDPTQRALLLAGTAVFLVGLAVVAGLVGIGPTGQGPSVPGVGQNNTTATPTPTPGATDTATGTNPVETATIDETETPTESSPAGTESPTPTETEPVGTSTATVTDEPIFGTESPTPTSTETEEPEQTPSPTDTEIIGVGGTANAFSWVDSLVEALQQGLDGVVPPW